MSLIVFLNKEKTMIKIMLYLMDTLSYTSPQMDIARGLNKYPENWKEFKRYIKFKIRQK